MTLFPLSQVNRAFLLFSAKLPLVLLLFEHSLTLPACSDKRVQQSENSLKSLTNQLQSEGCSNT